MDLQFRVYKPEGVLFQLSSLTKKRTMGAAPKKVFFAAYPHDTKICAVECLWEYENRTAKFRVAKTDFTNSLFLSDIMQIG